MALSRKTYEAVARILKDVGENYGPYSDGTRALIEVRLMLQTYFAQNNPRFDRGRFYDAAEPERHKT